MIDKPEIRFNQKWLLFGYGLSVPGIIFLRESKKQLYPTFENLWHELSHEIDWQTGYTVKQYWLDFVKHLGFKNHPAEIRARRFAEYHMNRFYNSGLTWEHYLKFTLDELNRYL